MGIRVRRITYAEACELLAHRSVPRLLLDILYGAVWLALPFTFR